MNNQPSVGLWMNVCEDQFTRSVEKELRQLFLPHLVISVWHIISLIFFFCLCTFQSFSQVIVYLKLFFVVFDVVYFWRGNNVDEIECGKDVCFTDLLHSPPRCTILVFSFNVCNSLRMLSANSYVWDYSYCYLVAFGC